MLDNIKSYLFNVGLTKFSPMAVMGVGTMMAGLWAAQHAMLEQFGITYTPGWPFPATFQPTGPGIYIELDTLTKATLATISALWFGGARIVEHHTIGTVLQNRAVNPPQGA